MTSGKKGSTDYFHISQELCSQSYHLFDPPKPVNERMDIYGPENLHLPQRYTEQSLSKFTVEQVYHLYDCEDYLRKNLSALDPEGCSLHDILERILFSEPQKKDFATSFWNLVLKKCHLVARRIHVEIQLPVLNDEFMCFGEIKELSRIFLSCGQMKVESAPLTMSAEACSMDPLSSAKGNGKEDSACSLLGGQEGSIHCVKFCGQREIAWVNKYDCYCKELIMTLLQKLPEKHIHFGAFVDGIDIEVVVGSPSFGIVPLTGMIKGKGFSGTKRYFGDLGTTLRSAGSNIAFAAVAEISDSVLKGAVSGFQQGILKLAMEPSVLRTALMEGGPDRKILLDRSPGVDELYIEGYIQAMLDSLYRQEYLRVRVIDNQVILKNLPPNHSLINEITGRVKEFLREEGVCNNRGYDIEPALSSSKASSHQSMDKHAILRRIRQRRFNNRAKTALEALIGTSEANNNTTTGQEHLWLQLGDSFSSP
ncbi:hypothetical protein D0Y65_003125 [Glycine soja]|uniref:Uncharacterized protein n=1 Tax=Glycine soja TaxID=3848 RepID=A0A445LK79_GLYSO|nr:hypothetical protein D0Y65_003125 [Glycine soja]